MSDIPAMFDALIEHCPGVDREFALMARGKLMRLAAGAPDGPTFSYYCGTLDSVVAVSLGETIQPPSINATCWFRQGRSAKDARIVANSLEKILTNNMNTCDPDMLALVTHSAMIRQCGIDAANIMLPVCKKPPEDIHLWQELKRRSGEDARLSSDNLRARVEVYLSIVNNQNDTEWVLSGIGQTQGPTP